MPRETAHELLCAPGGLFSAIPLMAKYGDMVARRSYEPVGFTAENGLKVSAARRWMESHWRRWVVMFYEAG